jgi:hypothetical protein
LVRLIRYGTCNYTSSACVSMNPSHRVKVGGEAGEHATLHESDLCGNCAIFDACMRHVKMLCFWYSNIYACITHVHTYVWGTFMQWLSLDTLPRLVIIDNLYIHGPAWTSITSTNNAREVTRVDSSSLGSRYRIVVRRSW